ncbi:hypothetical protein TNCV_4041391 [Trichonephila clavipes]|nr:hypothetical protein TNCV_4041391 [Trichonephila clavipes]
MFRVHTEYVLVKSVVRSLVGLNHERRDWRIFPPFSLHAEIAEVEIEVVSPSIVPSGNFTELKSYCHLYGAHAHGQRQAYLLPMPR